MILIFPNINKIFFCFSVDHYTSDSNGSNMIVLKWTKKVLLYNYSLSARLPCSSVPPHEIWYDDNSTVRKKKKVTLWWEIVSIKSRLHFICFAVLLLCFHFEKEIVSNWNQQKKVFLRICLWTFLKVSFLIFRVHNNNLFCDNVFLADEGVLKICRPFMQAPCQF